MDGDKFSNWGYRPASTPVPQQRDDFSFVNRANNETTGFSSNSRSDESTNQAFFLSNTLPTTYPRRPMVGAYPANMYPPSGTSSNSMVDLNQSPYTQDPLCDPNYMNVTGNVPNFYPQQNPLSHQLSCYQSPGLYRNSSIMGGNAPEIIDLTKDDDSSDFGNTHGPRVSNSHGPGVGNPVNFNRQHVGGARNLSQNQFHSIQSGNLRRVDRNFLSLGNEYKSNVVSKFDPDSRAAGDDQIRHVPPSLSLSSSQVKNHVDTGLNRDEFAGFQNTGRLTSSQYCMSTENYGSGSSFLSNVASMNSSDNLLKSQPPRVVQPPQANREYGYPKSSNNNGLSFIPNPNSRYGNTDRLTESAGPPGSTSAGFHIPARLGLSSLSNDAFMNSSDNLSNSRPSHIVRTPQANRVHNFPKSSANNLGFIPNRGSRYASTNQYGSVGDRLTESAGTPGNTSAGFHHPAQMGVSSVVPSAVSLLHTAAQTNLELQRLLREPERNNLAGNMSSSQYIGGPASRVYPGQVIPTSRNSVAQAGNQSVQALMRSNQQSSSTVSRSEISPHLQRHLQASDHHAVPPMKRGSIQPDPSYIRAQRQRMVLPQPSSPHVSSWPQAAPAGPLRISASRAGPNRDPRPSGYNCMLCKRDLAFPPEGPIRNLVVPPGVAVLPCQHTFHDECLQRSTPCDQATNPPCIPCALGEE